MNKVIPTLVGLGGLALIAYAADPVAATRTDAPATNKATAAPATTTAGKMMMMNGAACPMMTPQTASCPMQQRTCPMK